MQVMNIININDNSNKLFYIGGVVRDEILGKKSFDIDITYVGNAIEYCSKFGEVIQENPDFGTIKVNVDGKEVDFASTRSESYSHKGHLPVVEKIGCSLKEDVMRRDFTINALAKSVTTGEIVDYVGGLEDIKNKKLRVLHDESFIDDPTRIIRGLKFSVRFGFELEEHTKRLQDEYLSNINYDMSYKRVKKELIETFYPHPNFCHSRSENNEILPSPTKKNVGEGKIQFAFEKFINEKIYKLVTPNDVKLPNVNIEELVNEYILEDKRARRQEGRLVNKSSISKNLQVQQTDNSYSSTPLPLYTSIWLIYVGVLGDLSRLPLTKTEQKILDDVPQRKLKTDFEIYKAFENARIETVLLYAILRDEKAARRYLDVLRNIKIEITGRDLQKLGIQPSPKYQEIFDEVLKQKLKNPNMTKSDEIEYLKNVEKEL